MQTSKRKSQRWKLREKRELRRSDALRAELAAAGILVENTKDGIRWRRK